MLNIFISYRRDDSVDVTERIYEKLVPKFRRQNIFKDVDSIPLGVDFRKLIAQEVSRCDVLLAVIGRDWLECRDEHGNRRLDNDGDFVRSEIQEALRQDKPVIPLLVRGASMPRAEQLPPELRDLAYRNATPIRPDPDFRHDVKRLIQALQHLEEQAAPLTQGTDAAPIPRPPSPVLPEPGFKVAAERPAPRTPLAATPQLLHEIVNSIGTQMVLIPAGEFMMGSPDSDRYASDREKPQHWVRITKPFYLGKYLVTQEQWEAVMGSNPSLFKGPKNPVEGVSWDDCQVFLGKLNEKTGGQGGQFVLPSEAQWEYACRAGSTTRYCIGDDSSKLDEYAWYGANSDGKTHPVGEKKPNAWGLYDVHGNVWEWCQDWYDGDYYAKLLMDDPIGAATGSNRVVRGGSWDDAARHCRSANRSGIQPGYRISDLGMRVSLVPADK